MNPPLRACTIYWGEREKVKQIGSPSWGKGSMCCKSTCQENPAYSEVSRKRLWKKSDGAGWRLSRTREEVVWVKQGEGGAWLCHRDEDEDGEAALDQPALISWGLTTRSLQGPVRQGSGHVFYQQHCRRCPPLCQGSSMYARSVRSIPYLHPSVPILGPPRSVGKAR